jgi:hypothetical protein
MTNLRSSWWIAPVAVAAMVTAPRLLRSQTVDNALLSGDRPPRCADVRERRLLDFPSMDGGPSGSSSNARPTSATFARMADDPNDADAGWAAADAGCNAGSQAPGDPWACLAIGRRHLVGDASVQARVPLAIACSAGIIDACQDLVAALENRAPLSVPPLDTLSAERLARALDSAECWFSEACVLAPTSPACAARVEVRTARFRLGCSLAALQASTSGGAPTSAAMGPCRGLARSLEALVSAPVVSRAETRTTNANRITADLALLERACRVRVTAGACGAIDSDDACATLISMLSRYEHDDARCALEWAESRCPGQQNGEWDRTCAGIVRLASHGELRGERRSAGEIDAALTGVCSAPNANGALAAECAQRGRHAVIEPVSAPLRTRASAPADPPWLAFDGPIGFSKELRIAALTPFHSWVSLAVGGGGRLRWYWFELGFGAEAQWRGALVNLNSFEHHWFDLMFALQPGFVVASWLPRRASRERDFLWTISAGALLRGGPSLSLSLNAAWNADVGGYVRLSRHSTSSFGSGWGLELALSGASWSNWTAVAAARLVWYL